MQNGGEGGLFELPQEVLSILSSDPYEQLDVARTITAMAVAGACVEAGIGDREFAPEVG
jgi:hypothetical protein